MIRSDWAVRIFLIYIIMQWSKTIFLCVYSINSHVNRPCNYLIIAKYSLNFENYVDIQVTSGSNVKLENPVLRENLQFFITKLLVQLETILPFLLKRLKQ